MGGESWDSVLKPKITNLTEWVLSDRCLLGDMRSFHLHLLLQWVTVAGEWLPFAHGDAGVSSWHLITDSTQSHTAPRLRDKPVLGGVTQNMHLPMLLQTHAYSHTIWRWMCRDMLVKAAFKMCLIMKSFDSYDLFSCTQACGRYFALEPREVCGEGSLSAKPVAVLFLPTLLAGWTGMKSRFSFFLQRRNCTLISRLQAEIIC